MRRLRRAAIETAFLFTLLLSFPGFALSNSKDGPRGKEGEPKGTSASSDEPKPFQRIRISLSLLSSSAVSGNITNLEPRDSYATPFPAGFGIMTGIEVRFSPSVSCCLDIGFQYFPVFQKIRDYTDDSLVPPVKYTYYYSELLLVPVIISGKLRFPISIDPSEWFNFSRPVRVTGFSPYLRPGIGFLCVSRKVQVHVENYGPANSSFSNTLWNKQTLPCFKLGFGFDTRMSSHTLFFMEIMFLRAEAPKTDGSAVVKSDPIGFLSVYVGFQLAF
ncbi:MAG: hypothetical protein ACYTHN_20630 [Planctomycetota bacterium]